MKNNKVPGWVDPRMLYTKVVYHRKTNLSRNTIDKYIELGKIKTVPVNGTELILVNTPAKDEDSLALEINQEALKDLTLSDLCTLNSHIRAEERFYSSKEARRRFTEILGILQAEIDARINNVFIY